MNTCLSAVLFVPASRPDRIQKALATKANIICIDLEDGVALEAKDSARRSLITFLKEGSFDADRVSVRMNDPTTELGQKDLAAIADVGKPLELLLIPKAVETATIDSVFEQCPCVRTSMILVETVQGLSNVFALAAHKYVRAVCFGSADWSTEVGCAMKWDALLYARSRIIHAAIEGGSIPIDGAWLHLDDDQGLKRDSLRLRDLGFQGRLALHPKQIPTIQGAFVPDAKTIAHAKKVLKAAMNNQDGAFQVDGMIVDKPMIKRARQILEIVGISDSDAAT